MIVCGKSYRSLRLPGHGKGGYSTLAEYDGQQAAVKQIHHEPCDYYSCFGKDPAQMKKQDSYDIATIMMHLEGWEKTGKREVLPLYGKQRLYARRSDAQLVPGHPESDQASCLGQGTSGTKIPELFYDFLL